MATLLVDGVEIAVEKKPIKNMYLRVSAPDGAVRVSAPKAARDGDIVRFIRGRMGWVKAQQARLAALPREPEAYETGETLLLWGQALPLRVEAHPVGEYGVRVENGEAVLSAGPGSTPQQRKAMVEAWRGAMLAQALPPLAEQCQRRSGLYAQAWRIRGMRTRWGSCNTREKRVTLNLRLTEFPPECLEYVILHELTHLAELSHGPAFWDRLSAYCPDWKRIRARLNASPKEPAP